VFNCGANVGVFTRTALNRGAWLVVAIEPAPNTVECLRRNFSREVTEGRVIVVPKGVWDHPDVLELALGDDGNSTGDSFVFARNEKKKVKVPLTTIDILANEMRLSRVDFIKMDIEGAELRALHGSEDTLRKFKPDLAISLYHKEDDFITIPAWIDNLNLGYRLYLDHFTIYHHETVLFATADWNRKDAK
jgi:FkbM family methyltransferase